MAAHVGSSAIFAPSSLRTVKVSRVARPAVATKAQSYSDSSVLGDLSISSQIRRDRSTSLDPQAQTVGSVEELATAARRAMEAAAAISAELERLSFDDLPSDDEELFPTDHDRQKLAEAQRIRRTEKRQQRAAARITRDFHTASQAAASSFLRTAVPECEPAGPSGASDSSSAAFFASAYTAVPPTSAASYVSSRERRRLARVLSGSESAHAKDAGAEQGASESMSKRRRTTRGGGEALDSVRVYLKEIGQTRLLTADEEVELSRDVQSLLNLERARVELEKTLGRPPSSPEWASSLAISVSELDSKLVIGRQARDRMVSANLRLVVSIAKKYVNRGLSFQDLIQEGSIGLIRGAEKFDYGRGFKFSTYAHWWIRQAITRATADQSRTIRLPVHLFEIMSRIKKVSKVLSDELGRAPIDIEIAKAMEITVDKLQSIYKAAQTPLSLEAPVGNEEKRTLEDTIEADIEAPEEHAAKELLKEDLDNVLNTLTPRERDVLRLRYGLDDGRIKTLEEIGGVFKVTRERIRQIEAKALRKLRQPSRNSILREYLEV